MIELFNAVKTALEAIPEIKTVLLFRGQMRYQEIRAELPIYYPAVFIDIKADGYDTNTDDTQTGRGTITIRLAEHQLAISDAEFFTLRQSVHSALQGLRSEDYFSGLMRVTEEMDPDFDSINVWAINYETMFADNSAKDVTQAVSADLGTITKDIN